MSFTDKDILSYINVNLSAMSDVLKKHFENQQQQQQQQQFYYLEQQPNMGVQSHQSQITQLSNQPQQVVSKSNEKNSGRKQKSSQSFPSMPPLT